MTFDQSFIDLIFDRLVVFDLGIDSKIGAIVSIDTNYDGWRTELVLASGKQCTIDLKYALSDGKAVLIDQVESRALHSEAIDDVILPDDSPYA